MKTLPEAFVTRMKALLGEEYAAYEASFAEPAVKSFRVNTNKISLEFWIFSCFRNPIEALNHKTFSK